MLKLSKKEIVDWLKSIAIVLPIVILAQAYVFQCMSVDGTSMESTLHHKDRIYVNKLHYRFNEPKYGDIVIICPIEGENTWIKRIVGVEGDRISIKNGIVYRNGKSINENYINKQDIVYGEYAPEIVVPKDFIYFLGDNRNHSMDSRVIGPISRNKIVGKAEFRFYPFSSFGSLK